MRPRLPTGLLVLALAAAPARAAKYAGTSGLDFLNLDANARAVALGGAYTALASDANALLYNPAGLGRVSASELTFMHDEYVQGLAQEYMSVATVQGLGASVNYLRFGDVTRTRIDAPDGTLGTFGLSDLALSGGYGRSFLGGTLSAGAGLKYLRESVDDIAASGEAVDAGVMYAPPPAPGLTLGASLLNLGPGVRYATQSSPLPTTARLGAAYAFDGLGARHVAAFDLTQQRSDALRWGLGFETTVLRMMALRLGFTSRNDAGLGLTGGVGWAWQALSIDYAFSPYGDLGLAHRISLSFRWGRAEAVAPEREAAEDRAVERPSPRRRLPSNASIGARFDRVDELIDEDRYAAAADELSRLDGALDPGDRRRIRYEERQGLVAFRRGDCERAKAHYVEALKLASSLGLSDASVADSYAGVGFCLLAQGRADLGARFLRKALEAGPSPQTRRRVLERLR